MDDNLKEIKQNPSELLLGDEIEHEVTITLDEQYSFDSSVDSIESLIGEPHGNNLKKEEQLGDVEKETNHFEQIEELENNLPDLGVVYSQENNNQDKINKKDEAENIILKAKKVVSKTDSEGAVYWGLSATLGEEYIPPSKPIDIKKQPLSDEKVFSDKPSDEELKSLYSSISIPPDTQENIMRFATSNSSITDDTTNIKLKLASLTEGIQNSYSENKYKEKAINEEETEITNGYTYPGSNDRIISRKSISRNEDGLATGLRARSAIMDALGLCSFRTVILPHSGIVAVISAPMVNELIDLQTQLDISKINVGKSYGGNNYGTLTWYCNSKIVDLFIKKIDYVNVKNHTPEILKRLISILDIPTIAWELACSKYPEGYKYNRVILKEKGETELVIGNIRLDDCQFTLNNRLSVRQKQFLVKANNTLSSVKEILSYQRNWLNEEDFPYKEYSISRREVNQGDNKIIKEVILKLGDSNVENYEEHGNNWDLLLNNSANEILTIDANKETRANFMSRKINATALRELSHFIKEIVIRNTYINKLTGEEDVTNTIINNADNIVDMLDNIGNDSEYTEKIDKNVTEWVNDNTKIVYGVPIANESEQKAAQSSAIVPINPVVVFFYLTGRIYHQLEN